MNKIYSLQILRAIAALWIMLFHISIAVDQYKMMDWGISWLNSGEYIGVIIFFILSGFVNIYSQANKNHSYKEFFIRRFVRVYPIYYALLPLSLLGCAIVTTSLMCDNTDYLASILLIPLREGGSYALDVAWTLQYEVGFFAILAIGIFVFRKRFYFVMYLLLIWVGAYQLANHYSWPYLDFKNSYLLISVSHYWLYLCYGGLMGLNYSDAIHNLRGMIVITLLSLIPITILILIGKIDVAGASVITFVSIWVVSKEMTCSKLSTFLSKRNVLLYVAKISYPLYLSHILVIGVLKRLWGKGGIYGDSWQVAWIMLMIGACIVFASVLHEVVEKPLTKFFNRKLKGT